MALLLDIHDEGLTFRVGGESGFWVLEGVSGRAILRDHVDHGLMLVRGHGGLQQQR
jgi:hypothetical protein